MDETARRVIVPLRELPSRLAQLPARGLEGPRMIPVEFEENEQKILTHLRQRVKPDGFVAIYDTELIKALKITPEAFFIAKNKLRDAHQIACHIDGSGKQIFEMLVPEGDSPASKRWVFTVVPVAIKAQVDAIKKDYRRKVLKTAGPRPVEAPIPNDSNAPVKTEWAQKRDFAHEQNAGMRRLGVRPVGAPLRPPLRRPK